MGKTAAVTFNPLTDSTVKENDVPSLLDTSIKPGARKNILLIKVPYVIHPVSDYSSKEDAMLTSQLLAGSNVKTDYVNRHSNPENLVN